MQNEQNTPKLIVTVDMAAEIADLQRYNYTADKALARFKETFLYQIKVLREAGFQVKVMKTVLEISGKPARDLFGLEFDTQLFHLDEEFCTIERAFDAKGVKDDQDAEAIERRRNLLFA